MRYLASRGLLLLLTLLGLLSLFYANWRPVFILALCLLIVAHVCYSLIVNDSLLSPQVPAAFLHYLTNSWTYITLKAAPIMRRTFNKYHLSTNEDHENRRDSGAGGDFLGFTSTPLVSSKNGGVHHSGRRSFPVFEPELDNSSIKEETSYPQLWNANSSVKIRPKASGIKTVQTVAGPLLASTRYNIDPKVYYDVESPGLTTRLNKYASEYNSKSTHQSRYGVGQFPKVNLYASPKPLIKPNGKKSNNVTVRVAQPVANKLTTAQKKAIRLPCLNEGPSSKAYQSFKDIPLKRHASRDDVTELAKKQRTKLSYQDELGNLEEMTQKRARDDSSKTDEETSLEQKSHWPKKRTKTPSCNDIINSLSSSIHVLSGLKRKAEDSSCEIEKHFKAQDKSQSPSSRDIQQNSEVSMQTINESTDLSKSSIAEDKRSPIKPKSPEPTKLSDKLFMGAQPENNEKLRALIEEQGTASSKFSLDDKDEIRKEDITLMRQTSMKARLQSMFDAISGKTNKINPDVVIHVEEIGKEKESIPTSLNSTIATTTTTNINTLPTTSVIAPILKTPSDKMSAPKHVTFNFSSTTETPKTAAPSLLNIPEAAKPVVSQAPSVPNFALPASNNPPATVAAPKFSFGSSSISTSIAPTSTALSATSSAITVASKPATSFTSTTVETTQTSTATSKPFAFSFGATTATATTTSATSATTTAPSFGATTSPSFSFGKTATTTTASTTENKLNFGTTVSTANSATKPTFSFGQSATAATSSPLSFGQTPKSTISTNFNVSQNTVKTTNANLSFGQTTTATTNATLSFGQTAPATTSATLSFGQTTPATTSATLSFGQTTPATTSATLSFGQTTPATTSAPLSFGQTATNAPTLKFGQQTSSATITSAPTLTFGQPATTSSSAPALSFGNTSTSTASGSIFGGAKPSLGADANKSTFTTPATTTSAFVFGSGTTTSEAFGHNSFNAAKTTASTSFTPSLTPSFNTSTTTTTSANLFNASSTSAASTTTSNIFGSTVTSPATTTTSSMFTGGAFQSPATNIFTSNTSQQRPTLAAKPFGTSATPAFGSPALTTSTTTPAFGATTTTTPSFGSIVNTTSSPAFNSSLTSSTFGSTTATPSFGATASAFTANTTASTTPIFGATTTNAMPTFGAASSSTTPSFATSVTSTTTPAFGSTTPSFGAQAAQTSSFNAPNLNFGATSNGFGNTATPSPFGGAPAQTSTFAGTQQQSTTATPATNFPNGSFSFGSNASQQQQTQPAAQTGFNFTANNATSNASGTGGVFQFGAGASKPAGGGFNFNTSTSTPNMNFGATSTFGTTPQQPGTTFPAPQGGNMFSIGTGSTAPRARTVRDRLRRQR